MILDGEAVKCARELFSKRQNDRKRAKEIINNCIAHQDYRLSGKINVEEFEEY